MSPTMIRNLSELSAHVGREVFCSDWIAIDQARIQRFADATDDQQWIHTEPERARHESSFGATIAHGFLTLSLLPHIFDAFLRLDDAAMTINYGLDRLRFPAPVRVGQRIRARLTLDALELVTGGVQARWTASVEIENEPKPACVALLLMRYYQQANAVPPATPA